MSTTIARRPFDVDSSPKRQHILLAAEQLFLSLGYGAVSMDVVARTASVSKATLYAHFVSKDVLFARIVAEKGLESPDQGFEFPDPVGDLREELVGIGQHVLRFMLRDRTLAIYRIAIAESVRFPELGRAFHENGPGRFCRRFSQWLERQPARVDTPDPAVATQQFMALLRCGVFLRASLAVAPSPTDEEIDATVNAAAMTWIKAFGRSISVEG